MNKEKFSLLTCIDLKIVASIQMIGHSMDLPSETVEKQVEEFLQQGLIVKTKKGIMLTQEGKQFVENGYEEMYGELRYTETILMAHQHFDPINEDFLSASTDWQQMKVAGQVITNDHSDPDYDAEVMVRIEQAVDSLDQILNSLIPVIPRFSHYKRRFYQALDQIDNGNYTYLLDPKKDSIHSIWFEFHEDLLKVLGRGRR